MSDHLPTKRIVIPPARSRFSDWVPFLLVAPALILYVTFSLYPMARSLALSLTDWDGVAPVKRFVGLANFHKIFTDDPVAFTALKNNLVWALFAMFVPTTVGLLLAVLLNRQLRGRVFLRAIFYGPSVLPLVATALIWTWLYNPHFGLINEFLRAIGLGSLARSWLGEVGTALPAMLVTALWQGSGFPMLLYLAALQGIPKDQYEAAQIDGAGRMRSFLSITLPWLKETTVIIMTLGLINSFRAFELIYAMTYGGPSRSTQTLATWMYFNTFQYNHPGFGAALAVIIAALSMIVTVPYIRIIGRR